MITVSPRSARRGRRCLWITPRRGQGGGMLLGMVRPAYVPPELRAAPFTLETARAFGVTPEQLRSSPWRALTRGVYASAEVADSPGLRLAAARLVVPPGSVVSGASATWLLTCDVRRRRDDPLEVTAPRGVTFRPRDGLLSPRQALVPDEDVVERDGVFVTSPLRTAFDLARRPDLAEGVVALDALWRAGLVDPADLLDYAAEHRGWRGIRQVPRVVDLADRRAESPMESRLRMRLVLGGLPRPEVQLEITLDGVVIARLDLAYPDVRLDIQYDGKQHDDDPDVQLRDRRRTHGLVAMGWLTLPFDAGDVYRRAPYIVQRVGALLSLRRPA